MNQLRTLVSPFWYENQGPKCRTYHHTWCCFSPMVAIILFLSQPMNSTPFHFLFRHVVYVHHHLSWYSEALSNPPSRHCRQRSQRLRWICVDHPHSRYRSGKKNCPPTPPLKKWLKHCPQFLLGRLKYPEGIKIKGYVKFGRANMYYWRSANGEINSQIMDHAVIRLTI